MMQAQSRIRRKPEATAVSAKGTVVKKKPYDPVMVGISGLTFIAALLTLVFFALSNWSSDAAPQKMRLAAAAEVDSTAQEVAAPAISASQLDAFYKGDFVDRNDPFLAFQGPVEGEDGNGPIGGVSAFGMPTAQLFAVQGGGWAAPFAPPMEEGVRSGLQ